MRTAVPAPPSRLRLAITRFAGPVIQTYQQIVHLVRRRKLLTPTAPPPSGVARIPPANALIGHLLLDDYDRTDLGGYYDLYNYYGALPVCVPIRGSTPGSFQHLVADRTATTITFPYEPQASNINPLRMDIQISDGWESAWPDAKASPETVLAFFKQTEDVQDHLRFALRVELNLPRTSIPEDVPIKVKHLWLEWPSPLSVNHGAAYLLSGQAKQGTDTSPAALLLKYDPIGRRLEWGDMPLQPTSVPARPDLTTFISQPLHLVVTRPADLFQIEALKGQIQIELPGLLLSGLHILYYDSIGRRLDQVKMKKSSRLVVRFELILADLFAQHEHLLFRQVFVEHITLRSLHISDLDSHLANSNFRLTRVLYNGVKDNDWNAVFGVEQIAKPKSFQAWVSLYNRRHATTVGQGLNRLSVGNIHIRLHALSVGNHRETGQALNRLQTALVAYFEETRR